MKVKVHCPCGARFEFEVEPVNGRMPVSLSCPTCGADATELANAVIRQQQEPATPHAAPMRVAVAGHQPTPPVPPPVALGSPPTRSSLRISKSTPDAPVYEGPADLPEAGIEPCHRHPSEPAVDHCVVCGKAICEKCRQQFGHVCSIFCRDSAGNHGVEVPVYENQRGQAERRADRRAKYVIVAGLLFVLLLASAAAWYAFVARLPKVAYSMTYASPIGGEGSPLPFLELIGPGRLFTIQGNKMSLLDVGKNTSIWSVPVPDDAMGPYNVETARAIASAGDLWLALGDRVLRLDLATGTRKDLNLPDKIRKVIPADDSFLVISGKPNGVEQVTRIALADGSTQMEETTPHGAMKTTARGNAPAARVTTGTTEQKLRGLATAATTPANPEEGAPPRPTLMPPAEPLTEEYSTDAQGALQFTSQLLEFRTVQHEAMKKKGPSVLDSGNVTASQGIDLAEEMMNDTRREETGGVEVDDVSRYQVTLHRMFTKDAPDWTGEVIGPPQVVPLRNVDLLLAGTNLSVFDKHNKKLWDTTLTFSPRDDGPPPVRETADSLYFADKGVLARFDLFTGNVHWRLPSVGVSEIVSDDRGGLYVATSTADAESIRYSQQVSLHKEVERVIMHVDPATGKVLWKSQISGERFRVLPSGKYLFSAREWQTQDPLRLEDGPDNNFSVKLLNESSGQPIWNYPVLRKDLEKIEIQTNWILLQFPSEARVLKFWSL